MPPRFRKLLLGSLLTVTVIGCEAREPASLQTPAESSTAAAPVKQIVENADLPRALGPYSHAIRAGDFLFTSGQIGVVAATGETADGFEGQARVTLENLQRVLQAAGSGMEDVVKTTVFLTDPAQFDAMNALFTEFFPIDPPVRSTLVVQLPRGLLISVDATAIAPSTP